MRECPGELRTKRTQQKCIMGRRTFLGLGGAAALMALLGPRVAWGGVGGGPWGAYGDTALPGAHFGYDAGWSYSYDDCVWLSASCNCTVGRMTELFMEVSVDAYVACGGIWYPTWSPDMPDTPTYAYIRDDPGIWLASAYWIIDTTYDHDYYVRMTGASLRVARRAEDWRCWCGADIKGLGGNAPGTHSVAEAPQQVPHHVLVHDRWWQGRVVTLQPRAAEHLFAGVPGAAVGNGSNVAAWSASQMTDQHWIVLESAWGRSRLVSVRTGLSPLVLDVTGGVWDDGANMQLWADAGVSAQSHWLHDRGNGYHLIVPECSGCGVDLYAGGQADGTNVVQWNCYNSWDNANQQWKLSEPLFHERDVGAMVVSGDPEPGGVLSPADPDKTCIPGNYPNTSGMCYRYTWYRGTEEEPLLEIVQPESEQAGYAVVEADAGFYLTCIVKAYTSFAEVPYRGEVVAPSVLVRSSKARVSFFADGEREPCFQVDADRHQPFYIPPQAKEAAVKPYCAGLDGWYQDRECAVLFRDGDLVEDDLDLFARNRVTLDYAMADRSCLVAPVHDFFLDEALSAPAPAVSEMLPASEMRFCGDRVTFARGPSVWFDDMGRTREASCAAGAYADAAASGPLMRSARLTRNTTAYLLWSTPAYDGIALS
ncbi:RICIN domain-containing protein [Gordonibacter sp.]|uniref:RICIN domain-containing protein n=1 Tax=Gordonibacter sp. TaxID=1968902 RepID=UPI002FCAB126